MELDNKAIIKRFRFALREVWPDISNEQRETEFLEEWIDKIQKDYWKKLKKSDLEVTINRLLK